MLLSFVLNALASPAAGTSPPSPLCTFSAPQQISCTDGLSLSLPSREAALPIRPHIALSSTSLCALVSSGDIYCLDPHTPSPLPTLVPLPAKAISLSASHPHTCALTAAGQAHCWPIPLPPHTRPLIDLWVGPTHTCTLDEGGLALCYPTSRPTPLLSLRQPSATAAVALHDQICTLDEDGALRCNHTPIPLPSAARALDANTHQLCALFDDQIACFAPDLTPLSLPPHPPAHHLALSPSDLCLSGPSGTFCLRRSAWIYIGTSSVPFPLR